jgi:hypothetical protein
MRGLVVEQILSLSDGVPWALANDGYCESLNSNKGSSDSCIHHVGYGMPLGTTGMAAPFPQIERVIEHANHGQGCIWRVAV